MHYLWLDLETTGLNPRHCSVIEYAAIVTDAQFREIDRDHAVLGTPKFLRQQWEPRALQMHVESGLAEECTRSTRAEWQGVVSAMLPDEGDVILAGRNPHFDRQWISDDRKLGQRLHYRMLDVTTIYLLRPDLRPDETAHRAMADIEADLEAARAFYEEVR
jgi:oligoribonuclease